MKQFVVIYTEEELKNLRKFLDKGIDDKLVYIRGAKWAGNKVDETAKTELRELDAIQEAGNNAQPTIDL